jgi:hypothetical protein
MYQTFLHLEPAISIFIRVFAEGNTATHSAECFSPPEFELVPSLAGSVGPCLRSATQSNHLIIGCSATFLGHEFIASAL